MRKLFVFISLAFAVSVNAQSTVSTTLPFTYHNDLSWRSTVGDTLLGTAADSNDIYIDLTQSAFNRSGLNFSYYPDMFQLGVDATDISNGEGLTLQIMQCVEDECEYSATLDTVLTAATAPPAVRFYDTSSTTGQPATKLLLRFKAYASAADTDSLSYVINAKGIYKIER